MSRQESLLIPVQRRAQSRLFAEVVLAARHGLQLSIDEAADRVGLLYFQWLELESGVWIPDESDLLEDLAAALRIHPLLLVFLADVSRFNRAEFDVSA